MTDPNGGRRENPRIYVASLSDYTAGRLHGVWIDTTDDIDEVWSQVNAMLAASIEPGAEEIAIHDYDGFSPCAIGEYADIKAVVTIGHGIARYGEAFAAWASLWDRSEAGELDRFEDMYHGSYRSLLEYADEILDSFGLDLDPHNWAPDLLAPFVHIDLAAFARSLGDIFTIVEGDHMVHVFEQ